MTCPASCTIPDCHLAYVDHLRGIQVSPAATPSRAVTRTEGLPDEPTARTRAREQRMASDLAAYKRLRTGGVRGQTTHGAAQAERELGG